MSSDHNQPLINEDGMKKYPSLSEDSSTNRPVENNAYNGGQQQPQNNQGYQQPQYNQGGYPQQQQNYQQNQQNQGYPQQNQGYQPQQHQGGYPQQQGGYPQQGYPQQNQQQGFNPNGQQPNMPGQQPMPNLNQQKIVIVREHSSIPCRMCGYDGMSTWRQSAGCTTYSWCVCLFCFTGIFGFWIPFCIDSCYDTEIMCSRCGHIKANVQADCC